MTDKEILEHIGLSPDELEDLFRKLNRFAEGLNPKQRAAFEHSFKTAGDAAKELQGVTAEQLEGLLRKYTAPAGILCFACRLSPRPIKQGNSFAAISHWFLWTQLRCV